MSAQLELNTILMDWDELLRAYRNATVQAAETEAEHKRLRARAISTEKHTDPKAPLSLCEAVAEGDPAVASALKDRLVAAAASDAMRGKLAWFRAAADGKRSEIASDRANAALYASSGAGA